MEISELVEFACELNHVSATVRVNEVGVVFEVHGAKIFVDFPRPLGDSDYAKANLSWWSVNFSTPLGAIDFARALEAGSFIADYLNKSFRRE